MTTSGTTTFNLEFPELVEEAFERAGSELRSGYDLKTARRSLNLLLVSWANIGINLWTIDSGTIPLVAGTATYVLPTDTVDLIDHVIRTGAGNVSTQADLTCTRISSSTYATLPNKLTQARPLQIWIQRLEAPQITLWPVPDNAQTYSLVYWRLRRLQDAGNGANTPDVPFRFLPALVAGLSYYLAMKLPNGMERLPMLQQQYNEALDLATSEDREKAAVRFVPRQMFIS
jgi:hypothetical protein